MAWSCHWIRRCVLVSVPSFSTLVAAGMKKTSVPMSSGGGPPGSLFQKTALSVSNQSATTSHFRFRRPWRTMRALTLPAAGFWPNKK